MMQQKLENCIVLQDEMNSLVNPNWKKARYPFQRAAWMEMVEALSTTNWKWWKQQSPDQYQLKLEMVDILHFMLSDGILKGISGIQVNNIWQTTKLKFHPSMTNDAEDIFYYGEMFIECAIRGDLFWNHYFNTMLAMGIDFKDIVDMYIGKNTLNIFRQKHGYKDGSYIKEWFGAEDNKTLENIMIQNPSFNSTEIYNALELAYTEVLTQAHN